MIELDPQQEAPLELFGSEAFWRKLYAAFREAVKNETKSAPSRAAALDNACRMIFQRLQAIDGSADVYLGDGHLEVISPAEREAFGYGLVLGNFLGLAGMKTSQKAEEGEIN